MKSTLLATFAVTMVACSSGPPATSQPNDQFSAAAVSWVGGRLDDMIEVWGPPRRNDAYTSPDKPGFTYWRAYSLDGERRCTITAYSDASGVITDVRVTSSPKCDEFYAKDLPALYRRGG